MASKDPVGSDNPLRNVYEDLIKIRSFYNFFIIGNYRFIIGKLENLSIYSRWTLRGDDLIPYQIRLGQIDNMRVDGKFMFGDQVPPGQAVLHFLLHKCYRFFILYFIIKLELLGIFL